MNCFSCYPILFDQMDLKKSKHDGLDDDFGVRGYNDGI